jgi:hypothetical protein
MELLLAVLLWVGVITQEEMPNLAENEALELFQVNAEQIEAEYPDEYGSIVWTYEDEVN